MPRKPRIVVPGNPEELIKLSKKVLDQHQALGKDSPLRLLEEPNWDSHATAVSMATDLQIEIDAKERDLKKLYGQRQTQLDILTPTVRKSRDTLTGIYASNLRRLGDFGFNVLESAAPAAKTTTPKVPKAEA
jgi:hypothetical protein